MVGVNGIFEGVNRGNYSILFTAYYYVMHTKFTRCYSGLLMLFTFVAMIKRQTATIRALLVGNYSDILVKVRKAQKGLRMQHISIIILVGEYPEGLRGIDGAEMIKVSRSAFYQKIQRIVSAGFIYKMNKRYYLTDSGQRVYTSVCREFDASMNEILKVLIEEARRRV